MMTEAGDYSDRQGKLIILSGPSGVGKSTICRAVVERLDNSYLSVSVTTRQKGPGEENGREYRFVSKQEFQRRIEEGLLLEYAEVFGNLYGTPKDAIDQALQAGKIVILEIDVQGARQVKARYPQAVTIFVLPPSEKVLAERIDHRGRDSTQVAARRLRGAGGEIAAGQYYDNVVVNGDLEQAIREVVRIIKSARVADEVSQTNEGNTGES